MHNHLATLRKKCLHCVNGVANRMREVGVQLVVRFIDEIHLPTHWVRVEPVPCAAQRNHCPAGGHPARTDEIGSVQ